MQIDKRIATLLAATMIVAAACGGSGSSAPPASVATATGTPAAVATGTPAASTVAATPGQSMAASGGALSGTITISGSSTVQPISQAVQELFNTTNPGVAITVDGPGTGAGFTLFCKGETDIQDASRAIKPTGEADVCAQNGVEYVELKCLYGLSIITAAADDKVTCLSFNDLYALIGPEAGPVNPITGATQTPFANWKDAQSLATTLGSKTVFPDAPLTITGTRRGVRHLRLPRDDGHRTDRDGPQGPDRQAGSQARLPGIGGRQRHHHRSRRHGRQQDHPRLGRLRLRRGEP